MKKCLRNPEVIEFQEVTADDFDGARPNERHIPRVVYNPVGRYADVPILGGGLLRADIGDIIIRGVYGELSVCLPCVFAAHYTEVSE